MRKKNVKAPLLMVIIIIAGVILGHWGLFNDGREYCFIKYPEENSGYNYGDYWKRERVSEDFISLFQKKKIKKIYFSGQASGIYIGLILKKFIEHHFEMEVQVVNPSAFLQNERFNVNGKYSSEELCMICPAHSGSTTGPIEMARICREQKISVICTTYNIESELAKLSDVVIL